jgi:hypothetical protein
MTIPNEMLIVRVRRIIRGFSVFGKMLISSDTLFEDCNRFVGDASMLSGTIA